MDTFNLMVNKKFNLNNQILCPDVMEELSSRLIKFKKQT